MSPASVVASHESGRAHVGIDTTVVANCWTTAGGIEVGDIDAGSRLDLRNRVSAAATSGFHGIGLNLADVTIALESYGPRTVRTILDDHGIQFVELEVLADWYATGDRRVEADKRRHRLLAAAEQLEADVIKAIGQIGATGVNLDLVAAELCVLAEQATRAGTRISIESSPAFDLQTPAQVLRVVEQADHPAAGVHLDNWQISRAGVDLDDLLSVPPRWIGGVDLSDGLAEPLPDFVDDCFNHRGVPGSGSLDVVGFVRAVRSTGYTGAWTVEILDAEYRGLPLDVAVAAAGSGATAVLSGEDAHPVRRGINGA